MDQETKDLLKRSVVLAEENNRILRGLRTANRISAIWKIVYLAFFIGSLVAAYLYAAPYLEQATSTYSSLLDTQASVKDSFGGLFGGEAKN